jgi:hypothetical protein
MFIGSHRGGAFSSQIHRPPTTAIKRDFVHNALMGRLCDFGANGICRTFAPLSIGAAILLFLLRLAELVPT